MDEMLHLRVDLARIVTQFLKLGAKVEAAVGEAYSWAANFTSEEFRLNAPVTVEPSASSRNAGRARVE
jgi:hypothetical protein